MKNNKEKTKKNLLICIGLCFVFIILISIILLNGKKVVNPADLDPKDDDVLNLSGFGIIFEKYDGDFQTSEIASHLNKVSTEMLPELLKETNNKEKKVKEYYNEYSYKVRKELGITSEEELVTFVNDLSETKEDLNTWYRLDVINDSYNKQTDKDGYDYFEYEVKYKDDNSIKFSLYFSKNKNKMPPFIIRVIK